MNNRVPPPPHSAILVGGLIPARTVLSPGATCSQGLLEPHLCTNFCLSGSVRSLCLPRKSFPQGETVLLSSLNIKLNPVFSLTPLFPGVPWIWLDKSVSSSLKKAKEQFLSCLPSELIEKTDWGWWEERLRASERAARFWFLWSCVLPSTLLQSQA